MESIRSLFLSHRQELKRYIRLKTNNEIDTEDIIQDAFCNVLGLKNFEDIENPKAYLYKTAANLAIDQIRKNKVRENYAQDQKLDESFEEHTIEKQMQAKRDLQAIANAMQHLPERSKRIFEMHRIEGKTYIEIGQELGISDNAVKKHIVKTLKFLRSVLHENAKL